MLYISLYDKKRLIFSHQYWEGGQEIGVGDGVGPWALGYIDVIIQLVRLTSLNSNPQFPQFPQLIHPFYIHSNW